MNQFNIKGGDFCKQKFSITTGVVLLSIPFIIVFIYTQGLVSGLDTIFSIDEPKYHYPTIIQFANQLPYPDISDYDSATSPLFHILVAICSKVLGTEVSQLRLINFFVTYISVVLLLNILVKRFNLSVLASFLFATLFALSPYYFREAFVILTDNLPVLWLLCFFNYYFRYKAEGKQKWLLLSMLFVMLLCLTRQTYLFVCLAVGAETLVTKTTTQEKAKILSLLFIAALPTFALFLIWKGVTPPRFKELHTRDSLINAKAILYGLSVLGFYTLFIPGVDLFKSFFYRKKRMIVCAALLTCAILLFSPLIKDNKDYGYLWYVAAPLPVIAGTSLLFWALLPLGVISLLCIWNKDGLNLFLFFLLFLFLSEIPNKFIFQRYYDSSIILTLIFFDARYHKSNSIDLFRRVVLIVFFIAYFVLFTMA